MTDNWKYSSSKRKNCTKGKHYSDTYSNLDRGWRSLDTFELLERIQHLFR